MAWDHSAFIRRLEDQEEMKKLLRPVALKHGKATVLGCTVYDLDRHYHQPYSRYAGR